MERHFVMEKSVAAEEGHQESDSANPADKSSGSLVEIDKLILDLPFAMQKEETEKFPHFSMRGYVAEMREKNRLICAPFASEDTNQNNLEEQLPPLIVPKHRYWRCKHCIAEMCGRNNSKEEGLVSKCCQHRLLSDHRCGNIPAEVDALVAPSAIQQNSIMEICNLTETHIDASPHKTKDKSCGSSSSHSKEERADIREMAFTGDIDGSGNTESQKIGEPLVKSSPFPEHADSALSLKLNNGELGQDRNSTSPDARDICPPIELQKCKEKGSAKICLSKKKNTAKNEQAFASKSDKFINDSIDEPTCVAAAQSTITPSIRIEEQDDASTDSDEISVGTIDHRHHSDDLNGLPRRKIKKVRLLADLMNRKESLDGSTREDHRLSNAIATTSIVERLVVAPEAQVPCEDIGKEKQSSSTKRKHSDEDSHSPVIRGMANVSKKARSSRSNSERPHMRSEVSNSEAEGSHRSKHNNDRLPSSWKKKTSIQINDDQVGRTILSDNPHDNTSNVASTACRRSETEKALSLLKGKRPEVENGETSMATANYSILGEVPSQVKQTELMRGISSRNQFQSDNGTSNRVGLDLSLGRPLSSEQTIVDNIPITSASFLQQKDRPGRCPHWTDKNLIGEFNVVNNPSSSQSVRKGLLWDLNERIGHTTGITLEKQKCSTLFESRGSTRQGKMDICGPSLKGKNVEIQGPLEESKGRNDRKTNKPFQQGSSEDIPMEIVELMARNQFERQSAGGQGQYLSKRTDNTIMGSARTQENTPITWWRTETPGVTNFHHANATSGIAAAVDKRVATTANSISFSHSDRSHFRLSHLEGSQLQMLSTFPGNQQKLCSTQFPVSGSSITGSQPSEGAKPAWLYKNENTPFAFRIAQKCPTASNNIETHACWTETQHKGRTISDIKAEEMKMQKKLQPTSSKPGRGDLHPNPRVPLDLYPNETITAMQLINLMNNGMTSNAASTADADRFPRKPYSPCGYHPSLSTDGRGSLFNRSVFLHQHQGPGVHSAGGSSTQPSSAVYNLESRNRALPSQLNKSHDCFPESGGLVISEPPCRGKDKLKIGNPKGHVGTSDSVVPPYCGRLEKSISIVNLEANTVFGPACPSRESMELGECHFNRNPAEFSIPEPGNEYTISGEALEVLKYSFYQGRSYAVNIDGRKRQRPAKFTTGREHARHRTS